MAPNRPPILSLAWKEAHRPVSLWELLERLDLGVLFHLSQVIEMAAHPLGAGVPLYAVNQVGSQPLTDKLRAILLQRCGQLAGISSFTGFVASSAALTRFVHAIGAPDATMWSISTEATHLHRVLQDELGGVYCLLFFGEDASLLKEEDHPMGPLVAERFASTKRDALSAGRCMALQEGTACVFHLMRVCEVALKAVCAAGGIPPQQKANSNWGSFLREIQDTIDGKRNRSAADPEWPKRKELLEAIHPALEGIKRTWRNPTMHVESDYTPEEARRVWDHVRHLMADLSARINESGAFVD